MRSDTLEAEGILSLPFAPIVTAVDRSPHLAISHQRVVGKAL